MLGVLFIVSTMIFVTSLLISMISKDRNSSFIFFYFFLYIVMLSFTFPALRTVVSQVPTGLSLTEIDSGTYKVGFVYQAGNNVSLGLELPTRDKEEKLIFYQFNKNAFDGEIKKNAKKLSVIETGDFKKLKLE